jgi:hypothetical protein
MLGAPAAIPRSLFKEIALRHPRAIKIWTRGRVSSAFWEDSTLFGGDQFHASDTGHAVFAEGALPAVEAAYRMAMERR